MDYKNEIEKLAATKAQKMLNAGKLSRKALNTLFEEGKVINNVNNRINARAKRLAGGVAPKKMNSKNFKRISSVDNLKSRAAIDTRRIMKHQGRQNEKVVAELRRKANGNVNIDRDKKSILDGVTGVSWGQRTGDIKKVDIKIPKATAKEMRLSPKQNKEIRALTARHEISGEAVSKSKIIKGLKDRGYPLIDDTTEAFSINNHASPDVLFGDAQFIKRLSPKSQDRFYKKNKDNITEFVHGDFKRGKKMNESEAMNMLMTDSVKGNEKMIKNRRYFDYNPTEEERKRAFTTLARTRLDSKLNISEDMKKGTFDDMYKGYKESDFFNTWKGDRSDINQKSRRMNKKPLATGSGYVAGNTKIPTTTFDKINKGNNKVNEPVSKSVFIDRAKKVAPITIGLGGATYGTKKLYDKKKKENSKIK